jgi:hypothetical protein
MEEYMSGQIDDTFQYNNVEYNLSAIEFPERFIDIYAFGIEPIEFHTACWRGFVATFTINSKKLLILNRLYTNNGSDKTNKAPLINGKLPKISTPEGLIEEYADFREYYYDDLDYAIPYTGSLIITKDLIENMYVHMGFQSPISYKNVLHLVFDNGQFIFHVPGLKPPPLGGQL